MGPRLPYSVSIVCSSTLLFVIQPMMARAILPRFGGSAGVWVTCMLFFQVVLLLGYLYAWGITRQLGRNAQVAVHAALLAAALFFLPVRPRFEWAPGGAPALSILVVLAGSVGLPYLILSTTSPLMQSWYAGTGGAKFPYRLFALSNAASLAALWAYPVALEPFLTERQQLRLWSAAYLLFAAASLYAALRSRMPASPKLAADGPADHRPLIWIGLAACASTLWLATANHLSQEVAPIPFLWVLPLSLYLLSFVLCFDARGWYRPLLFRWLLPLAWAVVCWRLAMPNTAGGLRSDIPFLAAALFVCCMFCHGELADLKPDPEHGLTYFYVMVALGGAIGGVFVGVVAPGIFNRYLELPIGITACVLLALTLLYGYTSRARLTRLGLVAAAAFLVATRFDSGGQPVVHMRNFYGALQVSDTGEGHEATRRLYSGKTLHGVEFLDPARIDEPVAYYGPESGLAQVMQSRKTPGRRTAIIGLGAGTVATYGHRGELLRFFEINPAMIDVASRYFRFLHDSPARTEVIEADGRLGLEKEPLKSFDVIVLDAFSDDSIPVHLMTVEAFRMYFDRLRMGGSLLVNITNRYLDLYPVVEPAAEELEKGVLLIHNDPDPSRQITAADWVVLSDSDEVMRDLAPLSRPPTKSKKVRLWTDDFSNLFGVLR